MTVDQAKSLGENSYVQIGLVIVLLSGAFLLGSTLTSTNDSINAMQSSIEDIKSQIASIETLIEERTRERWPNDTMSHWINAFRHYNPALVIPGTNLVP